ncbi:VCBS repeat domain-containing M23 family metallopeptidase [Nonomuraea phyllanthi]|uniref:VCBS repeat domain-containing M23 family metallopeptidase n=1 Tax=Nonomuraea phyllanthi TaxID=2219224 RepID=UPI0018850A3E|nr:VCBS repeat domain-containing M23 family metallopeptidase [Nonomuraea phyllanthi]
MLLTVVAGGLVATSAPASAAPNYQLPFPCGQKWRLNTWDSTHAPALDMVREPQSQTEGSPVVAPASGTVNQSYYHSNAGNMIQINHGGGHFTTYIHLQSRAVSVGDRVTQGQVIGRVGHTGPTSNGTPHLHYEQGYDANGDGSASWGFEGAERVKAVFGGKAYGPAPGGEWRNVESRNGCETKVGNSVTGDSYADLLAVDANGTMKLYSNNIVRDNGQPYTGSDPREVGHGWSTSTRIIPADVTGDGYTDLLAVDANGTMKLYSNNIVRDNGQPYTGSDPREVGHGWSTSTRIIPADVTGDGYTDLLAVDANGTMKLYSNNIVRDNGQPYTGSDPREVGHGWSTSTRIIPADVTGDGYTDLLAVDASGTMKLYSNNIVRDNGQPYTGSDPREVGHGWSGYPRILA